MFYILVTLLGCQSESNSTGELSFVGEIKQEIPQFNFDNPSFMFDFDEQCFTSEEDYAIYLAAETEKQTLDFLFPISVETEKEIGKEFHNSVNYVYINDKRTKKLRAMLAKMQPYVSRKEITYQIYLIEDNAINAWTVPGGNIYFTTGILNFTESDDEIANILGHEIGHNEKKHTHRHIQRQAPLNMFFGNDLDWAVNLLSAAIISFNQHQELEADRTGMILSSKAGYNPEKGLEFWKRMATNERENLLEKLFRSHPYSGSRYDCGHDYLKGNKIDNK
jgi:predicted Zn-dependent protease